MALRVEGKDKPKTILSMEEGDELLKRGRDVAEAYDKARKDEKDAESRKETAKTELQTITAILAGHDGAAFDRVDVVELGEVSTEDGRKKRVFRKTVSKRSTISGEKLLELGVSANTIKEATVTTDVVSWTVADVKP